MLPTHRTMNNSRGDFYNDDKYEKSNSKKGIWKKSNPKVFFGIGIVFLLTLVYYFNKNQPDKINTYKDTPVFNPPLEDGKRITIPNVIEDTEAELYENAQEGLYENHQDELYENAIEELYGKPKDTINKDQVLNEKLVHPESSIFTQTPPYISLKPQDELTADRQQQIINAFRHAWKGYKTDAFGKDEYQPLTHSGRDWAPGGVGLMIVDALDTLMLMNLTDEYKEARHWIETSLEFDKNQEVNVFETTIRVLGGLLSAYHLSDHDPLYLEKAVELADRLLPAFNSPTGIPYSGVVLSSGLSRSPGSSSTAEATTVQLEFKYLSHVTGDMKYWNAAEKVMDVMDGLVTENTVALDGLVPIYINPTNGFFGSREIRLGSRGDSYYEYLLKQYLLTDKTEVKYRERYDHAVKGIKKHLIQYSYPNHLLYIAELMDSAQPENIHPKMDHLVCFMGGSFILGATEGVPLSKLDPLDKKDREDYEMAKEITRTCYEMYNMTATGLASEIVYFNTNKDSLPQDHDMEIYLNDRHNLLRPETLESLFIMYRLTGDEIYREWGWKIFKSFEKYTKLPEGGYAALRDVTTTTAPKDNRMDTFFLAETLKYLYLLFSPDDILPLDHYVLNTEAHPLPVFKPNF